MSNEKIRDLLAKLHGEIDTTEIDEETRSLIQKLDSDIHSLLNSTVGEADSNSAIDRARGIRSSSCGIRFSAEYHVFLCRRGVGVRRV